MSRLMSVAFTEAAVVARTKTVTRRKGWLFLKPGDTLTLCRKVMGRKPGEPLVRIAEVEVVSVGREPLCRVGEPGELTREGFPELDMAHVDDDECGVWEFWQLYFEPQGISLTDDVTRIEWRYLGCDRVNCDVANLADYWCRDSSGPFFLAANSGSSVVSRTTQ